MIEPLKVYILSPHLDDAAYGLTVTISKLVNCKIPVTLINCFTVTKWTALPVANKDVQSVSLLRANEDAAFSKLFDPPPQLINLDLLDAPLRNGYIFQNQPFLQNELELITSLEKLLKEHVSNGILFCPLAIGNHIDHAICRQAVVNLYKKFDVIFFEDLPYAQRISEDQIQSHVCLLGKELAVYLTSFIISCESVVINKEQAIRVYKSQLNAEISSEIKSHLKSLKGERIWGEERILNRLINRNFIR